MTFTSPWLLLLLATLPFILWLGWPSRGTTRRRAVDQLSVVYLVDHSDSMPPAAQQVELSYVRQALLKMGPNDKSAVIIFGGDALVERPLSANKTLDDFTSQVSTIQTNLAEAIRLGMALLPADTARRMVILSD